VLPSALSFCEQNEAEPFWAACFKPSHGAFRRCAGFTTRNASATSAANQSERQFTGFLAREVIQPCRAKRNYPVTSIQKPNALEYAVKFGVKVETNGLFSGNCFLKLFREALIFAYNKSTGFDRSL
jgi:hypothetical protein